MNKKILKYFLAPPFLLFFSFLWKIPLSSESSINFLDILLITSIIASFWFLKKENLLTDFVKHWIEKKFFVLILLLLFIFSSIASLVVYPEINNWSNSFGIIKSFIVLPLLFATLFSYLTNKKIIFITNYLKLFFIATSILSFFGTIAILTKNLTFDSRLALFYDSPNHFAMVLSPAIIIGIWMIFYKKTQRKDFFLIIIAIFLLIINLLLAKSLGSIIAIIFSIIFLWSAKKELFRLNYSIKIISILAILASFLFILNSNLFLEKINYQPNIPPSSIDSRLTIYQASEKISKNNLPWGIGVGNFQKKYLEYQKYFPPYPQWAVPHAHNLLFHVLTELGLIACFALFVLIVKNIFINKKRPVLILISALLIYFIVHGTVDTTIWHNDTSLLFWVILLLF